MKDVLLAGKKKMMMMVSWNSLNVIIGKIASLLLFGFDNSFNSQG